MEQYVGFPDFVQCTLECLDKLGWKFPNETYCVTQKERDILYYHLPDCSVKSSKQLVLRKDVRFGQQIHQSTFAYIGISDQRKSHQRASIAPLSGHLTVDFLQFILQSGNSFLDYAPVHLYLGFTHTTSCTDSTSLSLEVSPHACQPGQHVIVFREFDLCLGICSLCPLGKDFEYKAGPVNDPAGLYNLLDIPLLHASQFVIENNIADFVFLAIIGYFLKFSASDICCLVRSVNPLHEFPVRSRAGCHCQELQFVKVFIYLPFLFSVPDDTHEDGLFKMFLASIFNHKRKDNLNLL